MEVLNDLLGYPNRKIYQDPAWFAFSLDSVLLANFVTILPSTKRILDIGTGTAPIPLILSLKTKAQIVGVEIQSDVAKMAQKSVSYNALEEQIQIVNQDICDYSKQIESDTFDVIVCNPPYFKVSSSSKKRSALQNVDEHKAIARHEVKLVLEDCFKVVRKLLKNDGVFAMVHRTDRLLEIIDLYRQYGLEPKKLQFIYPRDGLPANMVLIEGVKHGHPGVRILPPLIVHEDMTQKYTQNYRAFIKENQNESEKL